MTAKTDAISIITAAFGSLAEKRVLDAGCGRGVLARSLVDRGARVCGLDPNSEALEAARRAVPEGTFHPAGAETMPLADDSFDGVIFMNSLHHVPKPAMPQALREAARVAKRESPVVVIEPLAEGPLFSVLKAAEDETDARAAAQDAIDEAIENGTFEQLQRTDYPRRERFTDLEHFASHAAGVDPARAAVLEERHAEIEAAFQRYARTDADGHMVLEQPMRARVLVTRA